MRNKKLIRYFFLRFFKTSFAGFSLIELLTAVAIVGILSVFGMRSYKTQINKAKTVEAKHSLSYVWTGQTGFEEVWGTYHENLVAVNIMPLNNVYNYDVGFGAGVSITKTKLEDFALSAVLDVAECTHFHGICDTGANGCLTKAQGKAATTDKVYFGGGTNNPFNMKTNCKVTTACSATEKTCLKHWTGSGDSAKANAHATETEFKAFAIGKLRDDDVWSINEQKTVEHLEDGT